MKRDSKKVFFGLLLFYIPVKLLGDVMQRSDLPLWVACPTDFLLGVISVVVIRMAVKRLDW